MNCHWEKKGSLEKQQQIEQVDTRGTNVTEWIDLSTLYNLSSDETLCFNKETF